MPLVFQTYSENFPNVFGNLCLHLPMVLENLWKFSGDLRQSSEVKVTFENIRNCADDLRKFSEVFQLSLAISFFVLTSEINALHSYWTNVVLH